MGTMFLIHSVLTKFKFQSATGSYGFNVNLALSGWF